MTSDDRIKDHMTVQTHTVGARVTIKEAEALLEKHNVRHLPVLHGGKLVGILSDRDVVASRRFDTDDPDELPVEEACTQEVYVATPETPLKECVSHMAKMHLGCTVIAEDGRVLGIFTTTDACRILADRL